MLTVYDSFHAPGPTVVHVFSSLDPAIHLLIAGSYTPFLGILFPGELWAKVVFSGMWGAASIGVMLTSFYHGPAKMPIKLVLHILMSWAAVSCLKEMLVKLNQEGAVLLIAGGVLYTIGVLWFVRNAQTCGIPDHTLWHIFGMSRLGARIGLRGAGAAVNCSAWHGPRPLSRQRVRIECSGSFYCACRRLHVLDAAIRAFADFGHIKPAWANSGSP